MSQLVSRHHYVAYPTVFVEQENIATSEVDGVGSAQT